jgi:hypothetical protein
MSSVEGMMSPSLSPRLRRKEVTMASTAAAATLQQPSPAASSSSWNASHPSPDEDGGKRDVVVEMDQPDENDDETEQDEDDGDDDVMDPEQLDEYKDMVERLGSFPVCARSPVGSLTTRNVRAPHEQCSHP